MVSYEEDMARAEYEAEMDAYEQSDKSDLNPTEMNKMKRYQINDDVAIVEYKDKSFAKWQVEINCSLDGKTKKLETSQCFNDFYDALIYIGLSCKGTEVNSVRYLQEFILDIVENNVSRFRNTPIRKEVFDQLQKINDV